MQNATVCDGHCCDSVPLKRPRYFPRQLITPAEMTLEQDYFRNRLRLHNRMLHGWGTVCGARVCLSLDAEKKKRPWCVVVKPGYLLGPCGDEIYIDREVKFDLRKVCQGGSGETCHESGGSEVKDPWCSDVYSDRKPGPLYVAVRYRETLARPVPVQPVGCGCDAAACEYSRWCDGWEICALLECPDDHRGDPEEDPFGAHTLPDCPPCPESPWVVLAKVVVDENGIVTDIDNCACRRIVASFASAWRRCDRRDEFLDGEEAEHETDEGDDDEPSSPEAAGGEKTRRKATGKKSGARKTS